MACFDIGKKTLERLEGTDISTVRDLRLAEDRERQITVLTRAGEAEDSNSQHAQGGIVGQGEQDSSELLIDDVLRSGGGLSHPAAVRVLAEEGPALLKEVLIDGSGVVFDRDESGNLALGLEGASVLVQFAEPDLQVAPDGVDDGPDPLLVRHELRGRVHHGLVDDFRDWPYSSYNAYMTEDGRTRIDKDAITAWFDNPSAFQAAHWKIITEEDLASKPRRSFKNRLPHDHYLDLRGLGHAILPK